ncbi:MAG: ABC transporter permease [Acidimicrobiales bacterium]
MLTLVMRSLRTHRSRLTFTIAAVTAAVSLVTASFVLADSLRSVFGDVADGIYRGVDAEIRAGEGTFDTMATGIRFDASDIEALASIDGVTSVTPVLGGENVLFALDKSGNVVRQAGPPTLSFSTFGDGAASPFSIVAGRAPSSGEVMLDTAQARALGVDVGDALTVTGSLGTEVFTLSGTVVFGVEESGVSPYFLLFDLPTMQRLLESPGQIDSASIVLGEGVSFDDVLPSIEASLPPGMVVADHRALVAEQNDEFGAVIDLIGNALLGFAIVTLFVSTFVIANTFAVLVGQQRQQMGLLRAIGAREGQATAVVVAEAGVVGGIASVLGLLGGVAVAEGIKALVESVTTGGFPEGPTLILPRTIGIAVAVGVGVTTLSAFLPARRAGKVSPLAAMQADAGDGLDRRPHGRVAPLLHRVLAATIGRVGPAGQIAATGIARNPRRVVTTSMSMVVGLAIIAAMAVLGASYRTTLEAATNSGLDADLIITGEDGVVVPYASVTELGSLPEIAAAAGYGVTEVLLGGEVTRIAGHQSSSADGVVVLEATTGRIGELGPGEAFVTTDFAAEHGLTVGEMTVVEFSDGHRADLDIRAVVEPSSVLDAPIIVDAALVSAHARNIDADFAVVRLADGIELDDGMRSVADRLASPQLDVTGIDDYVASRQARADQIMMLANGLLGLTVVVALVGIANTVALSLIERRAELGLLRAVGMSQRQVRRMVRYEALVLSSLGALTGVAIGIAAAAAIAPFLPASFIASVEVPVASLAISAVICIFFGVAAAALPARRAARVDVLDAINTVS